MIGYLKIIGCLGKNLGKRFTMHNLSKLTGIPYASFYRYVKHISEQGVLDVEEAGTAHLISLNLEFPVLKSTLAHFSFEEKWEFLEGHPIIKKIVNELNAKDIVLLFGSYAKKQQTSNSDIDLLIINKTGEKSFSFSKYELLFKKKINPIFVTEKEFMLMLQDKDENVGKQALKNHIILNNPEKFWGLVIK